MTRIIRDVSLLKSGSEKQQAAIDDRVSEETAVRTGDASRTELTFDDLTITRLSANTIFSFNNGGHKVQLNSGSMLLRVPKEAGGGRIDTAAVTVGITGTTVLFKITLSGRTRLTVMEGSARLTLVKYPSESSYIVAGQMLDVPAGASKIPPPQQVDLNLIMRIDPLFTDFSRLPSHDLILAAARGRSGEPQPAPESTVSPSVPPASPPAATVLPSRPPRMTPTPRSSWWPWPFSRKTPTPTPTPRNEETPHQTPKPTPAKPSTPGNDGDSHGDGGKGTSTPTSPESSSSANGAATNAAGSSHPSKSPTPAKEGDPHRSPGSNANKAKSGSEGGPHHGPKTEGTSAPSTNANGTQKTHESKPAQSGTSAQGNKPTPTPKNKKQSPPSERN